ncbi:HAD family phosphatase [Candidatus Woesearchaeota archaeon]|nr:HAD family phosphatase [Candidatus Woesearchaeota archaeon]
MRYKLIVFDMDGVVFEHKNFWLELHKRLGTYGEGAALTKRYLKTDYERLVKEVVGKLWKGRDATPYYALVWSLRYEPGAQEVLRACKRKGVKTAIISSGPKHAAMRVVEECGLDYAHTQELVIGPDNRFTGELRYRDVHDKREELEGFAIRAGCTLDETVFVGHGHNDVTALRAAGLGVAYRPDDEEVRSAAKLVIGDLHQLFGLLES